MGRAAGLPGRGRPGDDPAGRRGRRRPARARVHHRALPARAHPARAGGGAGRRRAAPATRSPSACPAWSCPAGTDDEMAAAAAAVKATIAFYGSTPAYRPVLELHGWAAWPTSCTPLSVGRREDKWTAMRDLVDDEVLGTFAVVADPEDVGGRGARSATAAWSTGSASTRPTPRRSDLWDPLRRRVPLTLHAGRGGADSSGILALGIIVSSEEAAAVPPRPHRRRRSRLLAALGAARRCGVRAAGTGAAVAAGEPGRLPGPGRRRRRLGGPVGRPRPASSAAPARP